MVSRTCSNKPVFRHPEQESNHDRYQYHRFDKLNDLIGHKVSMLPFQIDDVIFETARRFLDQRSEKLEFRGVVKNRMCN